MTVIRFAREGGGLAAALTGAAFAGTKRRGATMKMLGKAVLALVAGGM
ncbi:MAG: hypothetical protein V1809_12065 [Planctomycetota bacterium]